MLATSLSPEPQTTDFLPLNGTDYVEFYVGNAKQAAYYYQAAWGFEIVAYAGLETGTARPHLVCNAAR
jgi:4-hydroxyphenylpyruvate dioxygenase-like putative hemolysin